MGATSIAPTRGCTPAWASIRMEATASAAPRTTACARLAGLTGEGVGAAVVVDVGVDVQQRVAEGLSDPVDDGPVLAFGDVGVGQEGGQGRRIICGGSRATIR